MTTAERMALKCPRCKADLSGAEGSRIFFCRRCPQAWEAESGRWQGYDLAFVPPLKSEPLPALCFPFWLIRGDCSVASRASQKSWNELALFLVPAFFINKINFFGDIGLHYFRNRLQPATGPDQPDLGIFPASRGAERARAYPAVYLQVELSHQQEIMDLQVRVDTRVSGMLLIPFYRDEANGGYIDSQLGWPYPFPALL